jgi:hypothetical protein
MKEIFFGNRVLQKTQSGSYILVIPPIWVKNNDISPGKKLKISSSLDGGSLIVKPVN